MRDYLRRNLEEIAERPWLRVYGAMLALTHVFTYLWWVRLADYPEIIIARGMALCWPFQNSCGDMASHAFFGNGYLVAYALVSLWAAVLFFMRGRRALIVACALLALATVLKGTAILQDYRLMGNYHYMVLLVTAAYLLLPRKKDLIPVLIVLFYVSAGTLKLNSEWLSGSVLLNPGLSGTWLTAACAYVIVLELGFSWLLLTRSDSWFFVVAVQFLGFHLYSIREVGPFYPAVMLCLDSAFVLRWWKDRESARQGIRLDAAVLAPLAVFAVSQLYPLLLPGDSALTGEGRLARLSMMDSRTECETAVVAREGSRQVELPFFLPVLQPRIHCDPMTFYSYAKALCRMGRQKDKGFELSLSVRARRSSEAAYHSIISERNFCRDDLTLSAWWINRWVGGRNGGDEFALLSFGDSGRSTVPEKAPSKTGAGWSFAVPDAAKGPTNPLVADSTGVYFGANNSWFYALNPDGSLRWKYYAAGSQFLGAPVVGEGQVFFATLGKRLYALDKSDGRLAWIRPFNDYPAPVSFDRSRNSLQVSFLSDRGWAELASLRSTDAKTLWSSGPSWGSGRGFVMTAGEAAPFYSGEPRLSSAHSPPGSSLHWFAAADGKLDRVDDLPEIGAIHGFGDAAWVTISRDGKTLLARVSAESKGRLAREIPLKSRVLGFSRAGDAMVVYYEHSFEGRSSVDGHLLWERSPKNPAGAIVAPGASFGDVVYLPVRDAQGRLWVTASARRD